jgi:DNA-binding response OmpR family regulator
MMKMDDEASSRGELDPQLRERGFHVSDAADTTEGQLEIKTHHFDVLMVAVSLIQEDGGLLVFGCDAERESR